MAVTWTTETEQVVEGRLIHVGNGAITFKQFLEMTDEDDDFELVNGALVPKMSAQYPHERRYAWLFFVLNGFARARKLGTVLGSRTAVKINEFNGRLPDVLFVRAANERIIEDDAIYAAPDLAVEIVSPSNTRAGLVALESDYRSIGIREILFWYPDAHKLVVLRKREDDYSRETITTGIFRSEVVDGLALDSALFFQDPLPDEYDLLQSLLAAL